MAKYILVEVTDELPGALRILRAALHRAALDHDIKCRDVPVGRDRPAQSDKLKRIFEIVQKGR